MTCCSSTRYNRVDHPMGIRGECAPCDMPCRACPSRSTHRCTSRSGDASLPFFSRPSPPGQGRWDSRYILYTLQACSRPPAHLSLTTKSSLTSSFQHLCTDPERRREGRPGLGFSPSISTISWLVYPHSGVYLLLHHIDFLTTTTHPKGAVGDEIPSSAAVLRPLVVCPRDEVGREDHEQSARRESRMRGGGYKIVVSRKALSWW